MFLVDENVSPKTVAFLRDLGHSVVDLREEGLTSLPDEEILEFAKERNLILITFDKHFANTIKYPPNNYAGVVRIRIHPPLIKNVCDALESLLSKMHPAEIRSKLIVLEKTGFRMRK